MSLVIKYLSHLLKAVLFAAIYLGVP